ncbi:MAG: hypothetical protein E7660_01820 [Ruminococcaceae bacterium]|nr:hypothetical protein [Oscillospiraceae bacterium]
MDSEKKINNQPKGTVNNLVNALSFTFEKLKETIESQSVIGDKIEIDGTTIIPVSKISAGFAGGGANITDDTRKKRQNPTGVGGSVTVTPLTFLVIDKDGVRLMNIAPDTTPKGIPEVATGIISSVLDKAKEKKTK